MKNKKYLTNLFSLLAGLGLFMMFSCGEDTEPEASSGSGPVPTYAEVKLTLDRSCATSGCHSSTAAAAGVDLSSEDEVESHAARSLIRVNAGTMPSAGDSSAVSYFNNTSGAKAALIKYLESVE